MSQRRPSSSVVGRERELSRALGYLDQGASVEVRGPRLSGRSAFLGAVQERLTSLGATVVAIQGIRALRSQSLAALHLAVALRPIDGRAPSQLSSTFDALMKAVRGTRSVILIDDADDLDDASWGVIDMVRRASGVPVVSVRVAGSDAPDCADAATAPATVPAYVVELSPLSHESIENVVRARLEGEVDARTLARIYAKSGGVVGLALNLVDAALRDGLLVRGDDEAWEAHGELWSPSLRAIAGAHLEGLDESDRDTLELVALVGIADVETVRRLADWCAIERLERRGLVRLVPSGGRQIVTVTPPLLVEFFRHEQLAARRVRHTETIADRLGDGGQTPEVLSARAVSPDSAHHDSALFVRLLQERVRARRLVAAAAWEAEPVAETAVDYIEALIRADAPVDELREVLGRTDASAGSPLARARFAVARAHLTAYVDRDVDAALEGLSRVAPELGDHAAMAAAAEVTLLAHIRGIPDDVAERLAVRDDHPPAVRAALREALLFVQVCRGRFADARAVYADLQAAAETRPTPTARALYGLVLLGDGDYDSALAWCRQGVDEARELLDIDSARAHGAVASLCLVLAGDYQPVDHLLETLLAAGNPLPFPSGVSLILANVASVIASRRGDAATARRFADEARSMRAEPGPLPGQAPSWSAAQLRAAEGRLDQAADLIWHEADRLWQRGARYSAALGFLTSVEIRGDDKRFPIALERAREVGGGLLASHAEFLLACRANEPGALVASFEPLRAAGRKGLAISALRRAAELYQSQGASREAEAVTARAEAYAASLAPRWLDTSRFIAASAPLTERELEVARLVAEGRTNPEIADELVLSVRTIESHMNRIMRKLGAANRQAVAWYIEGRAAS